MPSLRTELRSAVVLAALVTAVGCFAERERTTFAPSHGGAGGSSSKPRGGAGGVKPEEGGEGGVDVPPPPPGGQGGDDEPPTVAFRCRPADSKEPLPARGSVMSADAVPRSRLISVDTIFAKFSSACSACHIEGDQGGFHVTRSSFVEQMDEDVLALILSPDPDRYMPPSVIDTPPASERPEGDASLELAALLRLWFDAGKPQDVFLVEQEQDGQSPYLLRPEVGERLSNVGNCIPNQLLYGQKSRSLDTFFAGLERAAPGPGSSAAARLGLPTKLSDTDLFTLDSEELAKHGVIAYAPLYPLWSDGAGKLRHVRVPEGTSIRYDAETRQFRIPPNTRFYKTFLKKVVDLDGHERFRKIETRLIVARPDHELSGGRREQTALYGAYAWNDAETEATLVTDLLRNGEPFADRSFAVEIDEGAALAARQEVRAREAELAAEGFQADLDENLEVERRGLIRHYSIPGSTRCVQCHMGSPSADFVLGFTPLQIRRLPKGESGVIEESGPDELDQLDRLIDYGVISGLDNPGRLSKLEESQGGRKPRNDQELVAQGYMLGNCSHCHNPRGFPSTASPELAPLLDFLPSDTGGIFQFPLERTSPRIKRDLAGTASIAYVTPSLREITPKDASAPWTSKADNGRPLDAPWRSLVYRNVASPFTYSDDSAIFPHMPMNTPGFDCRAPRILGDWMVSIPARRKHPELEENYVAAQGDDDPKMDYESQPYVEVKPGEAAYEEATVLAERRLEAWHRSRYYTECPDTSDIVDPAILRGEYLTPKDTTLPPDGVPDRPHWVVTDLTETPGAWGPRRSDWYLTCKAGDPTCESGVLVDSACEKDACSCSPCSDQTGPDCEYCDGAAEGCGSTCWGPPLPPIDPLDPDRVAKAKRQEVERQVIDTLGALRFTTALEEFATTPLPFGLFEEKTDCDFAGVPRVSDFAGANRPRWMDVADAAPSSPVYEVLPGGAVFQMICINCHGPNADSRSRLADTVQTLTGGQTRIANLRDGFFGTLDLPGSARADVFGGVAHRLGLSSDELAARYLVWMGLGGTQRPIPQAVLNLVGRTEVLGTPRPAGFAVTASANMLAVAQELCRYVVPMGEAGLSKLKPTTGRIESIKSPLIETNGDAELWERLCSLDNPPPLRALFADFSGATTPVPRILHYTSFLDLSAYPAGAPIGNHRGGVTPYDDAAENLYPWCIVKPADPVELAVADAYVAANRLGGEPLPYCPATVLPSGGGTQWDAARLEAWAVRGAVNAGLMVFFYLDAVSKGLEPMRYDQCGLLTNP